MPRIGATPAYAAFFREEQVTQPREIVRNLPLAVSVLSKHVGRAGPKAASVVLRRSPDKVRALASTEWMQRRRPDVAALALAAGGRSGQAATVLQDALEQQEVTAATARRVAHAAVVLHDLPMAERALATPAASDDAAGREVDEAAIALSVVAAERGNLDAALEHLRGVSGRPARRLRERLSGEREVLRSEFLRTTLDGRPALPPTEPNPADRAAIAAVLHVVSTALPEQQSGYTIRTQGIVTGQRAAGMQAEVVTRLGFPVDQGVLGAAAEVSVDSVPYHRLLPRRGIPIPSTARQQVAVAELTDLVDRLQPQVLHAHSKYENAQVALMVGASRHLPVVYEARGFLEQTWVSSGGDPESDFYRWSRESETLCMQRADMVITLSEAMAADIEARGINTDRIVVVPNAVSVDFAGRGRRGGTATGEQAEGAAARTRLGISATSTVFGSVSTLNDYEGFDTVIDAMALMIERDVVLLLVGDGPARGRLEQRAQASGVGDRVVFTGRIPHDQVRAHLAALDVFVVPRQETPVTRLVPPIKPLEAMAMGLPVLASDLPPLVEIVRPGQFGQVAHPGEAPDWAREMAALRYAPEHRRDLGTRAAAFVAQERTWARAADRYTDVYAAAARR